MPESLASRDPRLWHSAEIEIIGCHRERFFFFRAARPLHSFPRNTREKTCAGAVALSNTIKPLEGARCGGGIKTSSARDRSIDYTPGKVRDPRSGWQAMCTDPSRSSKQYHATACASMHASACTNRSANHPRNAVRGIFVTNQPALSSRRRASNSRRVSARFFTHLFRISVCRNIVAS